MIEKHDLEAIKKELHVFSKVNFAYLPGGIDATKTIIKLIGNIIRKQNEIIDKLNEVNHESRNDR